MSADEPPGSRTRPVEAHHWLQALFDESPMAIGFARDGVMLDANPAFLRLFCQQSVAELRGRMLLELIAPSHRARMMENITQRARGARLPKRYLSRGLRNDGTEFPLDVTTTRVLVPDGPLTIGFMSDVSEREDALNALQESEERFRVLSAATFEGVFVHADGKILLVNEAGAAMYGVDPQTMVGASVTDLTTPEYRDVLADHLQRKDEGPYEGIGRRPDGTTFLVEVRGRTRMHQGRWIRVAAVRDVTERRRLEAEQRALSERVQQTQKLESLGVLAGGVAHDFNNILTVIANEAALAKRQADVGPMGAAHLDVITLGVERATDLCRQMLAYAGKARLEREILELSALVGEMSNILEASITKKATLVHALAADLPTLRGDATQLRQIVLNLVLNASEAISGPSGTLRVSTGVGIYDTAELSRPSTGVLPGGKYVWLEVTDDGIGMDAPTVAQIFDPFFTTKFVGRGLGMAAVLGIVRGHEGAIDIVSSLGQGTRVRVLFPASTATRVAEEPKLVEQWRPHGVVLLVDDEANVRISTALLLRGFGFEVVVASDGVEAIEAFRSQPGRIDAVLLDLTMPRMDGLETLHELRRLSPQVPVVLTTGYGSASLEEAPVRGEVADAVLPKPYPSERLLATLQRVMSR